MGGQNPAKAVTNAINNPIDSLINPLISGTGAALNKAGGAISEGLKGANQNVTRNLADLGADLAVAGSGNFNNFGQSLLKAGIVLGTGGVVNPNDVQKTIGDTGGQRFVKDQAQKLAEANAADAQAVIDAQNRDVANTIQGVVTANKTTPGRRQTLINGPATRNNTLLTLIGA